MTGDGLQDYGPRIEWPAVSEICGDYYGLSSLTPFWPQVPPGGYRLILPYDWEEKARAMEADRLEWVDGVKRRLGLLEPGDDAVARVAQWDADHGRWPRLEDGLTDWQKLGLWNEMSLQAAEYHESRNAELFESFKQLWLGTWPPREKGQLVRGRQYETDERHPEEWWPGN